MSVMVVAVESKLSQTMSSPPRSNRTIREPEEPGGAVKRFVHVALQVHTP